MQIKKIILNNQGFGMIETIIALMILVSGITASLSLMFYIIRNASIAKDTVIAINLAREGIEVARNTRDSNWLYFGEGQARDKWNCWTTDTDTSDSSPQSFIVQLESQESQTIANTACAKSFPAGYFTLQQATNDNISVYTPTTKNDRNQFVVQTITDSPPLGSQIATHDFKRKIYLNYLDSPKNNIALVSSLVEWQEHGQKKTLLLQTKLTDWWKRKNHDQ